MTPRNQKAGRRSSSETRQGPGLVVARCSDDLSGVPSPHLGPLWWHSGCHGSGSHHASLTPSAGKENPLCPPTSLSSSAGNLVEAPGHRPSHLAGRSGSRAHPEPLLGRDGGQCWGAGAEDRGSVGRRSRDGCADRPGDASPSGLTRRCPPKPGRPSQALPPLGSTGNRGCERQRFSWAHGRPRVGHTLDKMKDDAPPSGRPGQSANGTSRAGRQEDQHTSGPPVGAQQAGGQECAGRLSTRPRRDHTRQLPGRRHHQPSAEGSLKKRLSGQNPFPPRGR